MKMYIGNCTQQHQAIFYRLPETKSPRTQQIESGSQVLVSGDIGQKDIDAIVEQLGRYGMVSEDEIDRSKKFVGLCYQVGRPITVNRLRYLIETNTAALERQGAETRKNAAVAVNQELERNAPGHKSVEVELVEDDKPGRDATLNETHHVEDHERTGRDPEEGRKPRRDRDARRK